MFSMRNGENINFTRARKFYDFSFAAIMCIKFPPLPNKRKIKLSAGDM